jgi:hypothetical protein
MPLGTQASRELEDKAVRDVQAGKEHGEIDPRELRRAAQDRLARRWGSS